MMSQAVEHKWTEILKAVERQINTTTKFKM